MIDPFPKIKSLEREGNFNGVIQAVVENYGDLGPVRPELLARIVHYLDHFRAFISPKSIAAIGCLPPADLQYAGLTDIPDAGSGERPAQSIGRIAFPAVTSGGLVREIRVVEEEGANMLSARLQALDHAGAAVYRVLKNYLGRCCCWTPGRFSFHVLDPYGKDDPAVEGSSLLLPLAIALYSLVTRIPVPADLSATAALGRDGKVAPVANIREKLAILNRERFFIKRVLVSAKQEMPGNMSGCRVIRVHSLDDALSITFQRPPDAACFSGDLDIDAEIRSLSDQYNRYLIDTCIENADELIRFLELKKSRTEREKTVPALFTCYWKKGSCHCHKGEVRETNGSLKKAVSLYRKYPGLVRGDDYFDARVSYAVLLKDIFRYGEAENIHKQLIEEMEQSRSLDHIKGKNLSTLSQLYLAMHRFGEAEQYQRRAMKLIRREELCRNYGYLAQIHTRSGALRK
ncbi:MAG: hypothetical protein DRG82_12275 [Deltaproteobacteria bacterium]|nr:MAG: hypothetical protein DRG82_12275 [Deltaproteobacteria bacterium]